ncbi:MAG: gliding motility-associated C-terminal domain-containing protein [Solitalea sp.]
MLKLYRIALGNVLLAVLLMADPSSYAMGGPSRAPAVPLISAHPQSFSTCVNDPGQALSVTAEGIGPLEYAWEQKKGTDPWVRIQGANQSAYTPSTRQAGTTFYRVRVTSSDGSAIYTNAATVTIYSPPSFSISAPREAVCLNSSLIIRSGIDLSIWDIEWESSADGVAWEPMGIHETEIDHPTSSTGTMQYRIRAVPKGMPNPICYPISAPVSVTVEDCMRLSVSKTASLSTVSAGDSLTYTIQLTNRGPSPLLPEQTVRLTENLPEGFLMNSVTAPGTVNLDNQTWSGIELQAGESAELTISGMVASNYTGEHFVNTVLVAPPASVKNTGRADTLDQIQTAVRRTADLEITKRALQTAIKAGQALNYEITLVNNGPSRILPEDVFQLLEELPEGYQVRNYEAGEGVFNYLTGDWTEVDLEPGETATLTVYGLVDSRFEGDAVRNVTRLIPPDAVTDPVLPNEAGVETAVSREANLELEKSGPNRMAPNEAISYSVQVSNEGPSFAREVLINDLVPSEIVVEGWNTVAGPGAEVLRGESGTGNEVEVQANIPVGSNVVVRIRGTVRPEGSGEITNEATAELPPGISDPTPNIDSHTNQLSGNDSLLLRKRGPARAVSGEEITYTIQLINNTNTTLENIQFEDLLTPTDALQDISWTARFDDPAIEVAPRSGNSFPVNLEATIPPDQKVTLVMRGRIPEDFQGEIVNSARAVSGEEISTDRVETQVRWPASITLDKVGPSQVEAGAELTYTLTATNTGRDGTGALTITDRLPLGSIYIDSDNGTYHINYHTVSWEHPSGLAAGERVEHHVRVYAPVDAPQINNVAVAGGHRDEVLTRITPGAGLSITKTAPDSVYQEETFTYTLLARNHGPSTARSVTVTDLIPSGLELVDPGGGTVNGQEIRWDIPSMPRNGVRRFTVEVRAPSQSVTLTNSAQIRSDSPDPDDSDNTASAVTQVLPSADLRIDKTGPAEAYAGEEITYQLIVTNDGPSAATDILVIDRLPSGMQFISSDVPPADSMNPPSWRIPLLEPGASRTITVTVKTPGRVGTIRNITDVVSPVYDENPDNNRAVFPTQITPAADLEVIKEGTPAIDSAGVIRYEILIRNNGPSTALNVRIEDELPQNLGRPLSISNGGLYDAGTHRITWPALPAMAAGTERLLTVRVAVEAEAASFRVSNTVGIQSDVFDPHAENNRSVFETGVYPPADVFFELSPDRLCRGQTATLSGGGVRNNVPGAGVYAGPGIQDGQVNSGLLDPGSYEVTYTFTSPGGTKKIRRDTLHVLPAAFADAGPDLEILEGDSVVLDARATGEVIRWTPAEGLRDPTLARAVAAPATTTTYRLAADNPGSCTAVDEVTVFVYPRLGIPNAFTPNDDGVNDTWEIVNIEKYPDATVQVFNRNGDRIFFSRGYPEAWEGTFNNRPVPPGTYYYLVRPNGGILKPITGSVTIIR